MGGSTFRVVPETTTLNGGHSSGGVSELMLIISIAINYLPPKWYKGVFRFSVFILMLDFFLCLIWLPIAVHNTYGFRSAKFVFTSTCMSNDIFMVDWIAH